MFGGMRKRSNVAAQRGEAILAMRLLAVAGVLTLLTGACTSDAIPAGQMKLDIQNGTTLAVTFVVNGAVIKAIAPEESAEFQADQLPKLPWNAEVRTRSGRKLLELHVNEGDVAVHKNGSDGVAARVDLSCGRIDVWSGPPLAGPMPGPGAPGDCDP